MHQHHANAVSPFAAYARSEAAPLEVLVDGLHVGADGFFRTAQHAGEFSHGREMLDVQEAAQQGALADVHGGSSRVLQCRLQVRAI